MIKPVLLDRTACRLMTPELIERHDRLVRVLSDLADLAPTLSGSPEAEGLVDELARIRRRMERRRFPVIFCGRSQVGKSSTLSHIVRATRGQEPCLEGSGAATTCVVTRIHGKPRPEAPSGGRPRHDCSIRFMTRAQYEARVGAIRKYLGYAPDLADDLVLGDLSRWPDDPGRRAEDGAGDDDQADRLADRKYLRRLMESYRLHGQRSVLAADEGLVQPGEFDRRAEYTNHPVADTPTEYTLLGEVNIGYEVAEGVLDDRIELADSPGLNARLFADDLITQRLLPEVEGALIVVEVTNVAIREVYELMETFRRRFGTLEGRVWLLVTKLDALTRAHYRPVGGQDGAAASVFDHLANTARENGLPLDQVVLLSNVYHTDIPREADGSLGRATPEMIRIMLKLEIDASGRPVLPESALRYAPLEAAFRDVIGDGGIDRVRRIVGSELADQVQARARAQVEHDLARVEDRARRLLRAAQRVARIKRSDLRLGQWIGDIDLLMKRIEHDPEGRLIEQPGRDLVASIWGEDWAGRYPDHMRLLDRTPTSSHEWASRFLLRRLRERGELETIPRVFDAIGEHLQASEKAHGKAPLGDCEGGPPEAWLIRRDAYLADPRSGFFLAVDEAMGTPGPFDAVVPGQPTAGLDEGDYREMMRRKLEIASRSGIFALGKDVLDLLRGIREDLDRIDHLDLDSPGPSAEKPGVYDDLLRALDAAEVRPHGSTNSHPREA